MTVVCKVADGQWEDVREMCTYVRARLSLAQGKDALQHSKGVRDKRR